MIRIKFVFRTASRHHGVVFVLAVFLCLSLTIMPSLAELPSAKPRPQGNAGSKQERGAGDTEKKGAGEKSTGKKTVAAAETVALARGPFRIEVSAKGYFEPERAERVRLQPKAWTTFKIVDVVEHGARVKEGDVILRFDSEKLEEQLEQLRRRIRGSERKLAKMRIDREQSQARRRLDRESLERAARNTLHQWERYAKVGRKMAEERTRRSLQQWRYRLEYALEELEQLKKMYEADELTEETEEIVLKRTARDVESARWNLKQVELDTAEELEFAIPLRAAELEAAAERARLDQARRAQLAPLEDEEREMAWAEQEREHEELLRQLEKYEHDLESMTVRAPWEGVVYYGSIRRGRSGDAMSAAERIRAGATATPGSVLLTIVAERPLRVRADLAEKDLHRVRPAQRCRIAATAFPYHPILGSVARVDTIPLKPGQFDLVIRVDTIPDAAPVMPGMECRVTITAYHNENALTVPASALREEAGEWTVERLDSDGKFSRQVVEIGRRTKEKVEIVGGLRAGDRIKKSR